MSKHLPDRLRAAGINGYRSNLQAGDAVALPAPTFMVLFGDESQKRFLAQSTQGHDHDADGTTAG